MVHFITYRGHQEGETGGKNVELLDRGVSRLSHPYKKIRLYIHGFSKVRLLRAVPSYRVFSSTPNPAPRGGELSNVPVFERAAALENRHAWYYPLPAGKGV